jgi:hypothetical protein
MPLWQDVAVAREVAAPGEHGDQLGSVGRPGDGVLMWPVGPAGPHAARHRGNQRGDRGTLVIWEAAVDVGGDLRARPVVRGRSVRRFESGELAGGEDGIDGLPVGPVAGVAGLGIGAENLAGVVRRG